MTLIAKAMLATLPVVAMPLAAGGVYLRSQRKGHRAGRDRQKEAGQARDMQVQQPRNAGPGTTWDGRGERQ
jgi:hypothetical protein